jgi:hypothetical protein
MKIIARGTAVASQTGTGLQSCAFSSICVLPNGRWICSFRGAPQKGPTVGQKAYLSWSDDEGKTWSKPLAPFTPRPIDGKPGLFRAVHCTPLGGKEVLAILYWVDHSDPSLAFFNEETQGLLDSKLFLSRSADNGQSWSEPQLMDTTPFNVPTPFTGPVLLLADGRWACQFELNKHYYDTSEWHHSSVLMYSKDQGKTWPEYTIASNDPTNRIFYWDQRPGVLADGRIMDLFWTYDNAAAVYLNIYARESKDNGKTWSDLWDIGVPGQPAPPVSLPDGKIAMVYVDRTSVPVIKIRTSADGGKTWPAETELLVSEPQTKSQTDNKKSMQDAWAEMGKFSLGLPATALTKNGDVLATYYSGPETDKTDIKWARLHP